MLPGRLAQPAYCNRLSLCLSVRAAAIFQARPKCNRHQSRMSAALLVPFYCSCFSIVYFIDQRRLLFWRKMRPTMLVAFSRLNRPQIGEIAATINIVGLFSGRTLAALVVKLSRSFMCTFRIPWIGILMLYDLKNCHTFCCHYPQYRTIIMNNNTSMVRSC